MRQFLSKVSLVAFIFLFAIPTPILAQNWTPPAGPPLGNNTAAPVNVGSSPQTKSGRLTIDGGFASNNGSNLNGPTIFDVSPSQPDNSGYNLWFNFIKSYFLNDVQVGNEGSVGPEVKFIGRLQYKPTNSNGVANDLANIPQPGKVLKATDTEGTIAWGTAIPDGVNTGDTLIWNDTCNCWTTGPSGGNGTTTPSGLPLGTQGQTLWYSAPNVLQATSQINHGMEPDGTTTLTRIPNKNIYIGSLGLGKTMILSPNTDISGTGAVNIGTGGLGQQTNIKSPIVRLPLNNATCAPVCAGPDPTGKVLVAQDSGGRLGWVDPEDIGLGNGNLPPAEAGQTLWYNGDTGAWEATNKINHNDTTTNIDSENLAIRGSGTTPGAGRIPYAMNDEGKFGWNENFTYQLNQGGLFPEPVGQLSLRNPEGGIAILQNEGMSVLNDDVYVEEDGDLYLTGLGPASNLQIAQGEVRQLCYVESTKKIVNCTQNVAGQSPSDNELSPVYDTDFEIIRTHQHNGQTYTFQSEQTVTVEWCGGGGGGGGGGLGMAHAGGGGGGGGAAGECESQEIDVYPGDVLSWNIGDGGTAGTKARKGEKTDNTVFDTPPTDGGTGGPTSVYLQQGIATPVQLGSTVAGGAGGKKGIGNNNLSGCYNFSTTTGGLLGGDGAMTIREPQPTPCDPDNWPSIISTIGSWHDGGNGSSVQNSENGGNGGDGESPTGSIFQAYSIAYPAGSAGGRGGIEGNLQLGGTGGNTVLSLGTISNRWGGNGGPGNPGFGGGGGGGSFGGGPVVYSLPTSGAFTSLGSWGYQIALNVLGAPLLVTPDPLTNTFNALTTAGILDGANIVVYNNPFNNNHVGGDIAVINESSDGGKGGSGYVKISGLMNSSGSTGVEFVSPTNSQISLGFTNIPSAATGATIEVWGGGGGGGGVKTGLIADRKAGGGGAGGYVKVENVPKATLCGGPCTGTGSLYINVGAGGVAGTSSSSSGSVTNGGNGSNSFVKKSDGTILVSASGGYGGNKDISSSTDDTYPSGGAGGGLAPSSLTPTTITQGSSGASGAAGGAGGQNTNGAGVNNGAQGAVTGAVSGLSTESVSGMNGKVKLTWVY